MTELSEEIKAKIDAMSHRTMANLWRNAPMGSPYFARGDVGDYFEARFKELGGWNPNLSKEIGWK